MDNTNNTNTTFSGITMTPTTTLSDFPSDTKTMLTLSGDEAMSQDSIKIQDLKPQPIKDSIQTDKTDVIEQGTQSTLLKNDKPKTKINGAMRKRLAFLRKQGIPYNEALELSKVAIKDRVEGHPLFPSIKEGNPPTTKGNNKRNRSNTTFSPIGHKKIKTGDGAIPVQPRTKPNPNNKDETLVVIM
jgi:hypothetical protein